MTEDISSEIPEKTSQQQGLYSVKTPVFEGPLDLLLTLIQKRKLFVNDVSLAEVTDDYIAFIESVEEFPIADSAHFILVASTLVLIKSKSLLPNLDLSYEEEEDIAELEERLKVYQRIKELSQHVGGHYGTRVMMGGVPQLSRSVTFTPTNEVTVEQLHGTMRGVLDQLPKRDQIPQTQVQKVVSLKETIDQLTERVRSCITASFSQVSGYQRGDLITRDDRRVIVITFLAMLELVKKGTVHVSQRSHFEDIDIENSPQENEREYI